jgi:hypothetical protein
MSNTCEVQCDAGPQTRKLVRGLNQVLNHGPSGRDKVYDAEELVDACCWLFDLNGEEDITLELYDMFGDGMIEAFADRLYDTCATVRNF